MTKNINIRYQESCANSLDKCSQWLSLTQEDLFNNIDDHYCVDEHELIQQLYDLAYSENEADKISLTASNIIQQVRENHSSVFFDLEELLQEYSLSDENGVTLMCLAEALLRIPDAKTVNALIQDKLSDREWKRHFKKDNSLFVNASTWGLLIAGGLVKVDSSSITKIFKNSTKPVIRAAVDRAMRIMGQHFVLGRSIKEAMKNARPYLKKGYTYSYDMLGESAITSGEAERYFNSYLDAIKNIAKNTKTRPSLSIKLSALHPRFEEIQRKRVLSELSATVEKLIRAGIEYDVGITIDAEEADRLELTLDLFKQLYSQPFIRDWCQFGIVIQAYSKRALPALIWLSKLAKEYGDQIPVRLVKGAYWDSEIQHSQTFGLEDYPVYTQKAYTDTAYLACARFLLSNLTDGLIYPQFATHNAHTVASIKVMADDKRAFEFQRLHGMGDSLYDSILQSSDNIRVRIYAPVGSHEDLLPYLVRRLLENGANSSFVHQLSDERIDIKDLIKKPLEQDEINQFKNNRTIPKPPNIFPSRKNSNGINLNSKLSRNQFMLDVNEVPSSWNAAPIINGKIQKTGLVVDVFSPYNHQNKIGTYHESDEKMVHQAFDAISPQIDIWKKTPLEERCRIIERFGELLEANKNELIAICQREAGKTVQDSIDEVREAIDFCRYYPEQARLKFSKPISLVSPTGESNDLTFEGKGIFVCISPWNYPLAIFVGQLTAALVAGNVVIAKPAETTNLIAFRAVELLLQAGLPKNALQFLPGSGSKIGGLLNTDDRVAGVAFTGSNATARQINQTLANRSENAGLATLIAETGGLNAMVVDSTALPEQVATDVVDSAFSAAGQRCSALRVLYIQNDIAERVIELIKGMMHELTLGNPELLETDIGPVIDKNAQNNLNTYIQKMKEKNYLVYQVELPHSCDKGTFIAPTMIEISSITELNEERFGPILHVVKYHSKDIDQVINDINSTGYGLTFGIHSRNTQFYHSLAEKIDVGNVYINRNQIGAVVGVNPFGGCGLSGTGPKAGGPHYLLRFANEKTITNNTAAIGGNIDLLNES